MNRNDIFDAVMVITEKANVVWRHLDMDVPVVSFYRKGAFAGRAWYAKHLVEFNEVLASENSNTFMDTIIHEVAHLITKKLFPFAKQAHGPEFRSVCAKLGGSGDRCHSYNTASVKIVKTKTRYVYTCGCNNFTHKVKAGVHKKVSVGYRFTCVNCQSKIQFTGKVLKIK